MSGRLKGSRERLAWLTAQIAAHDSDECLVWPFAHNEHGYGLVRVSDGSLQKAHRVAYQLVHGEWPTPFGLHTCDNPPCFNPRHIVPGNQFANMADCSRKIRCHHGSKNGMSILKEADVAEIRRLLAGRFTQREVAAMFSVHPITVSDIATRRTWSHLVETTNTELIPFGIRR